MNKVINIKFLSFRVEKNKYYIFLTIKIRNKIQSRKSEKKTVSKEVKKHKKPRKFTYNIMTEIKHIRDDN